MIWRCEIRNSWLIADYFNVWKIKKNCHVFLKQFHLNFSSKSLTLQKINSFFFSDVKWCFNASWGFKGLKDNTFIKWEWHVIVVFIRKRPHSDGDDQLFSRHSDNAHKQEVKLSSVLSLRKDIESDSHSGEPNVNWGELNVNPGESDVNWGDPNVNSGEPNVNIGGQMWNQVG